MIHETLDLESVDAGATLVFTDRGLGGQAGSSAPPFDRANLGSHVGDEVGAVLANRSGLAARLGIAPDHLTFMHPDHGRGVALVSRPTGVTPGAELAEVDALVTDQPGLGLVALAADCAPILIVAQTATVALPGPAAGIGTALESDPGTGLANAVVGGGSEPTGRFSQVVVAVAAVHCGWRGLLLDVAGAAVAALRQVAGDASLTAFVGPAICGGCYAVPSQRAAEVATVRPEAVGLARDGQPSIDLRAGLSARLTELGLVVRLIGGCTLESEELFSHRRDGLTGRQAAAVVIRPAGWRKRVGTTRERADAAT